MNLWRNDAERKKLRLEFRNEIEMNEWKKSPGIIQETVKLE